MKINKFITGIFVAATVLFGACEDYVDTEKVSPEVPAGCQGVYFPATNVGVFELEPTDATEITMQIARSIKTGAVDVPIVVEVNDEDVYNVPATVSFADGDTLVSFKVPFPNAAEGITYKLRLAVEGDAYVNPYGSQKTYVTTQVTRVKWTSVTNPLIYVDGVFTAGYNVGSLPMYVEAEKAEFTGLVRYRFKNAYKISTGPDAEGIFDGYPYQNADATFDDSKDYYTVIEINTSTNDVFMSAHEIGLNWGYGMISIGSVYGNLSTNIDSYPLGKLKSGIITFPENSLFISESEYENGAAYVSKTPTKIYLTKEIFLADNLKIDDFNDVEYEEVEGEVGKFKSNAFDANWDQTLEKAIDIDEENDESEYKNLYYFADLYAWDYGLAFYYKEGGMVKIPETQPTGIEFLGNEVFVSQSATIKSEVEVNAKGVTVYTLGLTFHYEDGTIVGDFAEQFYYSEDAVSFNIEDFVGEYNLTGPSLFQGEDPADMDVEIAEGENSNELIITGVTYAEEIIATFDATTSTISIAPQALADYGPYDITLFTFDGDVSDTSPIVLATDVLGNINISPSSPAFGYVLNSNAVGGLIDGYANFSLTSVSSKNAKSSNKAMSSVTVRSQMNFVEREEVQLSSEPNFEVKGKISPRKLKSTMLNEVAF